MNTYIINNYSRLRPFLFFLPVFFLAAIVLFLYSRNALSADQYIQIQKDSFYFINHHLGHYPSFEYNLTQIGDALVFLSFLSVLFVYAPKLWEALLSGLLFSLLFSCPLKNLFSVPRPAATFNNDSFFIVGKALCGHNSLPSGHSIVIFTVLTVLFYAFMPQKIKMKILWFFAIVIIGLILGFTRVAVGAHYPLDVIIGGIFGYISGLSGIFISRKFRIFTWIGNKKAYPVFVVLFLICGICLINKIINEDLIIFYLAFISLAVSLYKISIVSLYEFTAVYAKK
ncbi:membrane-associated PAP2 superfamily phosphatase [Flavobacterium sp. 90]|uniref:phosphatase PAP2 family protein n=1 Tax=unclassified Flavobacterium TaxID=196869 RepID=UPI000EAFF0CF|nr:MULTISPECIES: phosphatase PAP2 family protein [unclassified Flavobacterium]RKR04996.1 membrane-associated PAP2 superfamily phosphatase [Flavobacterium sp. 81]TCK56313.1 membrane-associated PAP2 superfamily phosphatase [Flavobacterium sp. 90]